MWKSVELAHGSEQDLHMERNRTALAGQHNSNVISASIRVICLPGCDIGLLCMLYVTVAIAQQQALNSNLHNKSQELLNRNILLFVSVVSVDSLWLLLKKPSLPGCKICKMMYNQIVQGCKNNRDWDSQGHCQRDFSTTNGNSVPALRKFVIIAIVWTTMLL